LSTTRPVAMTETVGHNDYFVHGENALLCSPGDSSALFENIAYLLDNRAEAIDIGLAGRARVERSHTSYLLSQEVAKIIESG
jgi:glycosyltransferase involved in cell wall biosynthesis